MTNPTPHGQVPEALIDLIDAYAETRHRYGGIYNARTEAARKAVIEALSGVQALSAAPEAIAKLRHLYQNMVNGAVRDTASAKRIAEGLLAPAIEALERATPPAEQQAEPGAVDRTGCTAGTDEECTRRGCATSCPAQQAAPEAAPAVHASVKGAMWFTKKPVTIQAIQWTGDNLREVIAFTDGPPGPPDTRTTHAGMAWEAYTDLVARDGLKIYTLEGKMLASPGDWIIRGVKGEYYPCKDEIFRLTYAAASPTPPAEQQAAPKAAPTRTALPEGWTDCTIEFGNDGPEVVAYGPKRMMTRLAKWLGKYFAQVIAEAAPKAAPGDALDEAMRERDDAEDFIDALLDEVLGHERPEWSNLYGRADALNDVQERMTSLHKPAVDKAWGQFQSAMAAPQPAPHLPERDASLPAERQGLFRKFVVGRVDGSDKPGGKHHGCTYFVLDVDHDPCARPALAAYAAACESTHPTLAADLRTKWGVVPAPQPAPASLSDAQIAELMRDTWGCASIAPRHALEFARTIETEVRKQDDALIQQMHDALCECAEDSQEQLDRMEAAKLRQYKPQAVAFQEATIDAAKRAITAARARLGEKT